MPGTKRVINIGNNPDDGTGDLLRDALNKVNLNFDDVWEYTSVNSNLNITGDSINGTTDVIINPADTGAFKVTGDTIINPDGGNYNFTINGDYIITFFMFRQVQEELVYIIQVQL